MQVTLRGQVTLPETKNNTSKQTCRKHEVGGGRKTGPKARCVKVDIFDLVILYQDLNAGITVVPT